MEDTTMEDGKISSMLVQVCEFLRPKDVELVQASVSPLYSGHPRIEELKKHPTPMFRYPIVSDRNLLWKILDQLDAKSIINFASTIPVLGSDDTFKELKEWYDIRPDLAEREAQLADFWDGPYQFPGEPIFGNNSNSNESSTNMTG